MPQLLASTQLGEILGETSLTAEELARACGVGSDWVLAHVEAGVLHVERVGGVHHFGSITLLRARRIAQLEFVFDADPQLAALTTDLIEQVAHLRARLKANGDDVD